MRPIVLRGAYSPASARRVYPFASACSANGGASIVAWTFLLVNARTEFSMVWVERKATAEGSIPLPLRISFADMPVASLGEFTAMTLFFSSSMLLISGSATRAKAEFCCKYMMRLSGWPCMMAEAPAPSVMEKSNSPATRAAIAVGGAMSTSCKSIPSLAKKPFSLPK